MFRMYAPGVMVLTAVLRRWQPYARDPGRYRCECVEWSRVLIQAEIRPVLLSGDAMLKPVPDISPLHAETHDLPGEEGKARWCTIA